VSNTQKLERCAWYMGAQVGDRYDHFSSRTGKHRIRRVVAVQEPGFEEAGWIDIENVKTLDKK